MYSAILNAVGNFTEKDISLFKNEVRLHRYQKGEIILNKGDIQRSVCYLLKGSVYQYNYNADGHRNIVDLHVENQWFLNHRSLVAQLPSDVFMVAYKPCDALELRLEALHYLIGCSQTFLLMNKILETSQARVHFFDNSSTPLEKYQFILDNRPRVLQDFPLKMIASYLKITPETLSRTRKKWAKTCIF